MIEVNKDYSGLQSLNDLNGLHIKHCNTIQYIF